MPFEGNLRSGYVLAHQSITCCLEADLWPTEASLVWCGNTSITGILIDAKIPVAIPKPKAATADWEPVGISEKIMLMSSSRDFIPSTSSYPLRSRSLDLRTFLSLELLVSISSEETGVMVRLDVSSSAVTIPQFTRAGSKPTTLIIGIGFLF